MVDVIRLRLLPGRQYYRGGLAHPFKPGDEFELPAAEAAELVKVGHAEAVEAAPALDPVPFPHG